MKSPLVPSGIGISHFFEQLVHTVTSPSQPILYNSPASGIIVPQEIVEVVAALPQRECHRLVHHCIAGGHVELSVFR